jgi:hypothetical protein
MNTEDPPLLLLDVDGVISLFGFPPADPPAGAWTMVDGIGHLLGAGAGARLRALASSFELVWCTGWEEKANDYLPLALGLDGPLPWLSFDRNPGRANAHWKLAAIDAYVGGPRPLAWIDDAHDEGSRAWADARSARAPTLLVQTDPALGLSDAHVAELLRWAGSLGPDSRIE